MKAFKYLLIFSSYVFCSCQYFNATVPDENKLLQEELEKINWNEVDSYPTISSCDTIKDKEIQKECFFSGLVNIIQEDISLDTIQMLYPEIDTIDLKVTINADATLEFEIQNLNENLGQDLEKIDSILQNSLSKFPPVEPAIKRGIKVKTQFIIPIIIKVTE